MREQLLDRSRAVRLRKQPSIQEADAVEAQAAFEFASELGRKVSANTYNKYLVLFRRMWKILAKPAGLRANPWLELNNKLLCTHSRRELTVEELTNTNFQGCTDRRA